MDITLSPPRPASRAYSWFVLALLFGVYVMNMADRQIVGILAEEIKRDLSLTDGQIGILTGPAIGAFYAVLGVPMAYAADRVNRVRFVAISICVWSAMTMLGARATNLVQLALTRAGVSVAEAGGTPSSVSLIADYFTPDRRATAMAIWTAGSTVGIFVGFALGGVVNEAVGWRNTFLVAGMPGLILTLILLTAVKEPVRGSADPTPATRIAPRLTLFPTFAFLWKIRLFRQCIFAAAGTNVCVFAVLAWAGPFVVRSYGVGTAEAGSVIGTGIAVVGGTAMVLSGFITDFLGRRGLAWPLLFVAVMVGLSALLFALAFRSRDFETFVLLFTAAYGALMTNPPISWVILQSSSPPEMRAMATAIMLLVINMLSSVPAPLIVGYASDILRPSLGNESLGVALMLVPFAGIASAIQFVRVAQTAHRSQADVRTSASQDYVVEAS